MDAHGPPSAAASPSPSGAEAPSELDRLRTALALSQAREAELNAQLQRQEQLVQGLSRHVPGGLMMLDRLPDGHRHIPYASDGLFTLFDLDPALAQDPDALFQALVQRLHPDHRSMIQRWEVALALGAAEGLQGLFALPTRSIAEAQSAAQAATRQRARQARRAPGRKE